MGTRVIKMEIKQKNLMIKVTLSAVLQNVDQNRINPVQANIYSYYQNILPLKGVQDESEVDPKSKTVFLMNWCTFVCI